MPRPLHKDYRYYLKTNLFKSVTSFHKLEKRIENLQAIKSKSAETNKGDAMEVFVEALLNTDETIAAKKVFPSLKQTPAIIRKKLNVKPKDKGIDGIFINKEDEIVAYQVKFKTGREKVPYPEIAKFNNQSKLADKRYLIGNSNKIHEEYINYDRNKNLSFKGYDFDNLSEYQILKAISWLKQKTIKYKKSIPDPRYQTKIIEDVVLEFKTKDRATMLMACGSGKTLVAMWIAQKINPKIVVVFVPSLALIKQFNDEWQKEEPFKNVAKKFICSSLGDISEYDDQVVTQEEVPFEITTNYLIVRKFLNNSFNGTKIIYCTYQSSRVLKKAMTAKHQIDFAIFDEAHRTTQYKKIIDKKIKKDFQINWSLPLFDKHIHIKKRLFMTATSKVTKKDQIDKIGHNKVVYVMNNPAIYGKHVVNFTFVNARKVGAICPYEIIVSLITKKDLSKLLIKKSDVIIEGERIRAEQVALQIALKRIIDKFKNKKIFTFHNSLSSAKSFTMIDKPVGIQTHLKDFQSLYIDGTMGVSDRKDLLSLFDAYDKSIMSNARCLVEGVNVPSVDMVAFIQPKNSPTDIVQAAGRAMRIRNMPDKKLGYILVPLFIEKYRGEKIASASKFTKFDKVLKVIRSLAEYDQELEDEIKEKIINNLRKGKNRIGKKRKKRNIFKIISDKKFLSQRIEIDILNEFKINYIWNKQIALLLDYKKSHGLSSIPLITKKPYQGLGKWVHRVRLMFRLGKLSENRIKELNEIKMPWEFYNEEIKIKDYDKYMSFREIMRNKDVGLGWIESFVKEFNLSFFNGYSVDKLDSKGRKVRHLHTNKRRFLELSRFNKTFKDERFITNQDLKILGKNNFLNLKQLSKKLGMAPFNLLSLVDKKKIDYDYRLVSTNIKINAGLLFKYEIIDKIKNLRKIINFNKTLHTTIPLIRSEYYYDLNNLLRDRKKYKKYFNFLGVTKYKSRQFLNVYEKKPIMSLLKNELKINLTQDIIKKKNLIDENVFRDQYFKLIDYKITSIYKHYKQGFMIPYGKFPIMKKPKKVKKYHLLRGVINYFNKNEVSLFEKRYFKHLKKKGYIITKSAPFFWSEKVRKNNNLLKDIEIADLLKLPMKENKDKTDFIRRLRKYYKAFPISGYLHQDGNPAALVKKSDVKKFIKKYGTYKLKAGGLIPHRKLAQKLRIFSNEESKTIDNINTSIFHLINNNIFKVKGFIMLNNNLNYLLEKKAIIDFITKIKQFPKVKLRKHIDTLNNFNY